MDLLTCTAVIGAGATAVMDLWTVVRARVLGGRMPDYAWLGRWFARSHERAGGWIAIWGLEWARQPTLAPALIVGIGSVAAPFLIGKGRLQSFVTHTVFGFGLYAAAWLLP